MLNKLKTIEDIIISILQKGQINTQKLIEEIKILRPKTTKQAVYKILRKLKEEEVVVLYSKKTSLSNIWINKMADYFKLAQYYYSQNQEVGTDFLNMKDGDKITYSFRNPEMTDRFWVHAMSMVVNTMSEKSGVYIYNPHEWFLLARPESEKSIFDLIVKNDQKLFITIGGKSCLDQITTKKFADKSIKYYTTEKKMFKNRNYYLNIFGDFLIEVWLDKNTTRDIDEFYEKTKIFDISTERELKEIISKRGKNKLVISKNKKKSAQYIKILSKNFYI